MELLLKPQIIIINGFEVHFLNLKISENFKKIEDWMNGNYDYYIYRWIYRPENTVYYNGKGKVNDLRWDQSRFINHGLRDVLGRTINPKDWYCEIPFVGLLEKQALAGEAYLIANCNKNRLPWGSRMWDGISSINKKRERTNEGLIDELLIVNGNNYWETAGW